LAKLIRGLNRIGIITVTAAGNDNRNACDNHPGSLGGSSTVINVGAVTVPSGKKASFSNYGSCVSIWAPGDRVKTASLYQVSDGWEWWGWGNNGYVLKSGTSFGMLCPKL
jgi:subtilisin family serine protease